MNDRVERIDRRIRRRQRFSRIPRTLFKDRTNPIEYYNEEQFKRRFHLNKSTVLYLYEEIQGSITQVIHRGAPIPGILKLLVALLRKWSLSITNCR